MRDSVVIEDVQSLTINGTEIPAEFVVSTFYARIWRSATVVKNKRENAGGGIKNTVSQALTLEKIDQTEALALMLTPDKARLAEIKAELPQVDKTDEPTVEDVKIAVTQVLANRGQAS